MDKVNQKNQLHLLIKIKFILTKSIAQDCTHQLT